MTELNFRVILVPQEEVNSQKRDSLLARVKHTVENCEFRVESISYSQVKKSEEEDYPEIEELVLDIRASSKTNYIGHKVELYETFCSRWKRHFYALPCSYIEFYGNDSFVNVKRYQHRLMYGEAAFGVLPHNGTFCQYARLKPEREESVHFYHDTRNVVVEYTSFEVHFSYDNIRNIFVNIDGRPCRVYFDLFNPPIVFRIGFSRDFRPLKHRNLDFSPQFDVDDLLELLTAYPDEDFGSETTPKIDLDVLGRANVLSLSFEDVHKVREIIARIHYHCSEKSVYFSCISPVAKNKPADPVVPADMPFGCTYLVTALLKRNFVLASQTSDIRISLGRLHRLSAHSAESLENALATVLSALDSGKILNFWHAVERQHAFYTANRDEIHFKDYIVPAKCSMIRRVTLTPTRQLLWVKEIMFGNRVLRNFDSEYAVRVSFREDNMSRLSFNASYADPGVLKSCVFDRMMNGIRIGSRNYEFLAWSNSQIRDHGVWMYARDGEGRTARDIRAWMGDFSHIHNVPKYMARMGQCFSQTEDALFVPLDPRLVRTENDIEGGWDLVNMKKYCFSDGVGRISLELAAKVHSALGHDKRCSAFQIRYGGYKGMLVVDPTLKDAQIVFRKSMEKFHCPNSNRLEIAKTSAPTPLQLNRPFITLLDGLGVRRRMFLRLQEDMLKTLTDMLFDENVAAKFLRSKTPTNLYDYEELSKSGIYLTTEPFFKALLLALHRHHIENIKLRANIAVDPSKGRNMLGVIDETMSLNYGEVFVQYTKEVSYGETTKDTIILRGEVLVTKNPCMHPGDVRKFRAVDIPALHHITDCIVFPQKGPRPHPSEMAGSDLDGDEYSVLWAPELIFHGYNKTAADFPALNSPNVSYIGVQHMVQFLQDYIKNDHVGAIANAHLAWADKESIFSPICNVIAKKFSVAVDFAKNGKSQFLTKQERPLEYPDFMEKSRNQMYKSLKALGKMYRVCKDFESENEVTSISYGSITVDPDLVYDGWQRYEANAVSARNKYNALFRSVLRNYGIQHEAEALSGAFTHLHCRFQERKDRNEIEKVIIGCIKKLNKCMLEEFQEEFAEGGDVASTQENMLQKASAWYVVTYSDPEAKFLSFPWCLSKYLVNIKVRRTMANPLPFSPAIVNLDETILECEAKHLLPSYAETRIWNDYRILCPPRVLRLALKTLILWAQEEEIMGRPGHTQGLLFPEVFIKLFFHVSEKFGYVARKSGGDSTPPAARRQPYSAANLCLEFLTFCSTFRFYNKEEIEEILPFKVFKYSRLGKRAIVSYHKFALSGTFETLHFDKTVKEESIIMKPLYIDTRIFLRSPISEATLKKAEEALVKYSKVQELNLREILQTKKVCVSAEGTQQAIKELKSILRKKYDVLRQLFNTGEMPETKTG